MARGGYQIIDLKNKNLTSGVGMVYEDCYEKVKNTSKTILLTGIQVENVEYKDAFVNLTVSGSAFVGEVYGKDLKIEDTDVITITNK